MPITMFQQHVEDTAKLWSAHHVEHGFSRSALAKAYADGMIDLLGYKLHYFDKVRKPQTEAMMLGAARHKLLLEPEKFDEEFAIIPENLNLRKKADKEFFEAWKEQHKKKMHIKYSAYEQAYEQVCNAREYPILKKLLLSGKTRFEQSLYWGDNTYVWESGPAKGKPIKLMGKLDIMYVDEEHGAILYDAKFMEQVTADKVAYSSFDYSNEIQAAMYIDGARANGIDAKRFIFIAIANKPPYTVVPYVMGEEEIQLGRAQYKKILWHLKQAYELNSFPPINPTNQALPLTYSGWKKTTLEKRSM